MFRKAFGSLAALALTLSSAHAGSLFERTKHTKTQCICSHNAEIDTITEMLRAAKVALPANAPPAAKVAAAFELAAGSAPTREEVTGPFSGWYALAKEGHSNHLALVGFPVMDPEKQEVYLGLQWFEEIDGTHGLQLDSRDASKIVISTSEMSFSWDLEKNRRARIEIRKFADLMLVEKETEKGVTHSYFRKVSSSRN